MSHLNEENGLKKRLPEFREKLSELVIKLNIYICVFADMIIFITLVQGDKKIGPKQTALNQSKMKYSLEILYTHS